MDPSDKLPPWPAQAAWMRVECCVLTLQPILTHEQYIEVRTAVSRWATQAEDRRPVLKIAP